MNWISTKKKLPNSEEELVLAVIDKEIFIGSFYVTESWYEVDGKRENYRKSIFFSPHVPWSFPYCCACDGEDHDNDCDNLEKSDSIALLMPTFSLNYVSHWMPLPELPGEDN